MQNQQTFENDDENNDRGDANTERPDRETQSGGRYSAEVASEGGTPGDVELDRNSGPGSGTEATEIWQQENNTTNQIHRDDTGRWRRSPVE
jgi:hypothetical protein